MSDQDVKDLVEYKIDGDGWDHYYLDKTGKIQATVEGGKESGKYTITDFAKALSLINTDPNRSDVVKNVLKGLDLETTNALLTKGELKQGDKLRTLLEEHVKDLHKSRKAALDDPDLKASLASSQQMLNDTKNPDKGHKHENLPPAPERGGFAKG